MSNVLTPYGMMREYVDVNLREGISYSELTRRLKADFRKAVVFSALGAAGGNKSEAARQLKMDRGGFARLRRQVGE